ncbi:unnamed protein product, partial [Amoebophrya sp. A120]
GVNRHYWFTVADFTVQMRNPSGWAQFGIYGHCRSGFLGNLYTESNAEDGVTFETCAAAAAAVDGRGMMMMKTDSAALASAGLPADTTTPCCTVYTGAAFRGVAFGSGSSWKVHYSHLIHMDPASTGAWDVTPIPYGGWMDET